MRCSTSLSEPDRGWVELGYVQRALGLKGDVVLRLHNEHSACFDERWTLYLGEGAQRRPLHYRVIRDHGPGAVVARVRGVEDRTGAEQLRGLAFSVLAEALPEAEEGRWYVRDLEGLAVHLLDGERVGHIVAVLDYPTVDCLRVCLDRGGEVEVPMVDPWFERVELSAGMVWLRTLEGLLVDGGVP